MRLAGSDPCQAEISRVRDSGADSFAVFFAPRTLEEERTDAANARAHLRQRPDVRRRRLGATRLEPVIVETFGTLDAAGRSTRIPAELSDTRGAVTLLIGANR